MSLQCPEFRYVTEEALLEWKSTASGGCFKIQNSVPMDRFVYELCWASIKGDLPVQKCKIALDSVTFSDINSNEGLDSVLADILAHLAQDPSIPGDFRTRLVKLAKWSVDSSLVPQRLLQERCEEDFLWDSDLIKMKAQDLRIKEIRVNTRLLYQQTKFNLLREESEGYAKLVTLLSQSGLDLISDGVSESTISVIKSLIGHFDLDPNRVFDIVLECFELHPNCSIFYNLIPIFPKSNASQILGFKFQYYQRMEVNNPVPLGLYQLAALLVKAGLIDLDSVCVHLLPKDNEAFDHYNTFLTKRLDEVNKIGKINLAATGRDLMEEDKQEAATDLFVALDMENESVVELLPELESNQWLGLLIGFLSVDDWCHAHVLFDRLSHLNPTKHIQICDELLRVIRNTVFSMDPTISQNNETSKISYPDSGEVSPVPSHEMLIDPPNELFQMLFFAGPYLYRDALLLQKVCRVLRVYYLSIQKKVGSAVQNVSSLSQSIGMVNQDIRYQWKEARVRIEEALGSCILPSLQLIPANPAIGQEIWELLRLLPYEVRYRLYGEWEKEDEQLPVLLAARNIAKLETRRILKRLAKENLKQKGRMVAKLAHANPMTVLRTIVNQIEAYKDMIAPVVDAFKYLTPLEYDILEYVVIERLAQSGREKLKEDGLNLSDWLQSLASFWGHLCKKYPSMELRGLFQYLVNQLKQGTGTELVLLQELIQQMANVLHTENMTEDQLDAMAGSETLRALVTSFGMTRNNKALLKSTNRLRDSLIPKDEPKLAIPLLLLIAQHRSLVVTNADAPHIKIVSEQFDRCHGALLQYVDFLSSALSPAVTYAQMVPTLDDLVHKYHLEAEVAFLMYRPVMRLFKRTSKPELMWPLDCSDDANMQNDESEALLPCELVLDLGQCRKPIIWSDLLNIITTMLPTKAWNSLSPDFYATFWGLSLYDLYVPRSRYNLEIAKQHAALKALEELSDNSNSAITKRKKEKERIHELLDKLTFELQKHEKHVASVHRRMSCEKNKWLSSCLDTSKINVEFFQRCLFPRCIFSMPDAVYCAMFVQTVHSLGTPYFNTVNHIDILFCKLLHPMICSCTEFEAGRLGRFLCDTLKMVYHWKSNESIYERECANMPGFAVYYRFPNSQRVQFGQYVKVHLKWSTRLTKLLIQCLESPEYLEIRNALITLSKISSVFPVTKRSGVNLEKRVAKIKIDDREDLKVLATGVAAALASRKNTWISEDEFGMGYFEPKPSASLTGTISNLQNGSSSISSAEIVGAKKVTTSSQLEDQSLRVKPSDGKRDKSENSSISKSELPPQKIVGAAFLGNTDMLPSTIPSGISKSGSQKTVSSIGKLPFEEPMIKTIVDSESRSKRSVHSSLSKQQKLDITKDDTKTVKVISRTVVVDTDLRTNHSETREDATSLVPSNGNILTTDVHGNIDSKISTGKDSDNNERFSSARPPHPTTHDDFASSSRLSDKQQKRSGSSEDQERLTKRRKGESDVKDGYILDEKAISEEKNRNKMSEKSLDKSKEKTNERLEKLHREKNDRIDKTRADDIIDKSRDRSLEKYGREHSVERLQERGDRGSDRIIDKVRDDKNKDERNKSRHSEPSFHSQILPPPPPFLPSTFVPHSVGSNRREEDTDRRPSNTRHSQRLSPRLDEKEYKHSEERLLACQEEAIKRRREDDFRERKHDERDGSSIKGDEREREKGGLAKDDLDATSKRRKIKRDTASNEGGREYSPVGQSSHSPLALGNSQHDGRERDRKVGMAQHRGPYMDETASRIHSKEASKMTRRESDLMFEREREEEKRLRAEAKRKHRK